MKIAPVNYMHPEDKAALDNLKNLPMFTECIKAFMKVYNEEVIHVLNMGSKIRLGPDQLPELYGHLPPICRKLGIEEPEMYLEMNPGPNAYTMGDTRICLVLTSGLVQHLEEDELKAVIAHECGHIACRHVLYHTLARMLLNMGGAFFGLASTIAKPVELALYYWQRKSELSADRAAAVVMGGSKSVVDTMVRLAGGPKSITENVNLEQYIKQADAYRDLLEDSVWKKFLHMYITAESNHPLLSVRTREIVNWCGTEQYRELMEKIREDEGTHCPHCGAGLLPGCSFCQICGGEVGNGKAL